MLSLMGRREVDVRIRQQPVTVRAKNFLSKSPAVELLFCAASLVKGRVGITSREV